MGSNAIFFGWNRSIAGRERMSSEHFDAFVKFLTGLQQAGSIQSFEPVFLAAHGGDLNGFFLIRGDSAKLDAVVASSEWTTHMTRATMHLESSGAIRAHAGAAVGEMMEIWRKQIPA